ncbi:hypothetical protein [Nostoc sp.]|uniref:hypothetical protein n=1 Tax=Nostoc sp. TaxID=1180 RepID=UPI002FFA2A25
MIQNLSLRSQQSVAFAERVADKQSQDIAIASFRFAPFAMTIGHFFTYSTLTWGIGHGAWGIEH